MHHMKLNQFALKLKLTAKSPVHPGGSGVSEYRIRKGSGKNRSPSDFILSTDVNRDMTEPLSLPYFEKDGNGWRLKINGQSLKGASRHWLDSLINRIMFGNYYIKDETADLTEATFPDRDEKYETAKYEMRDKWSYRFGNPLTRATFGSERWRGMVQFEPLEIKALKDGKWVFAPIKERNSGYSGKMSGQNGMPQHETGTAPRNTDLIVIPMNSIDRFTHSVVNLFHTVAIPAETVFTTTIRIDNFSWWQIGLIAHMIAGINDGFIRLGSKTGIGHGIMKAEPLSIALAFHPVLLNANTNGNGTLGKLPGIGCCSNQHLFKNAFLSSGEALAPNEQTEKACDDTKPIDGLSDWLYKSSCIDGEQTDCLEFALDASEKNFASVITQYDVKETTKATELLVKSTAKLAEVVGKLKS